MTDQNQLDTRIELVRVLVEGENYDQAINMLNLTKSTFPEYRKSKQGFLIDYLSGQALLRKALEQPTLDRMSSSIENLNISLEQNPKLK